LFRAMFVLWQKKNESFGAMLASWRESWRMILMMHCFTGAGMSLDPKQSTWRVIRSIVIPVGKPYVFRSAKDPLERVVKQLILALLDPLHIVLRINNAEISAAS